MDITVNVWQLLGVISGVSATGAGVVWFLVRLIISQHTAAIEGRLQAQDKARAEATQHWNEKFAEITEAREDGGAKVAAIEARVAGIEGRAGVIEERLRHIPDTDAITEMLAGNAAMTAEMRGLRDLIAPMQRNIDRISDYLLNRKE